MPTKIKIKRLFIELTRRCNASCSHCMRGEAQSVDVTKEMINHLFINEEYEIIEIGKLFFTGGEVLLNKEILIYVLKYIIDNKIKVNKISFVTNGLIYDQEIIDLLSNLRETLNTNIRIQCRKDQFHPSIPSKTLKVYKKVPFFEFLNDYLKKEDIINYGRAKENKLGNETLTASKYNDFLHNILNKFEICEISQNKIEINILYLTAKGYILPTIFDGTWDMIDKISTQNIFEDSIFEKCEFSKYVKNQINTFILNENYDILEQLFNKQLIIDLIQAKKDNCLDIILKELWMGDNFNKYLMSSQEVKRSLI